MLLLVKNAKIVQPKSPHHGKRCDVLIRNGQIETIGEHLTAEGAELITGKDLWLMPALTDTYAFFREPGYEYKETLATGTAAAFRGGFTRILAQPATKPVIQTKGEVQALLSRSPKEVDLLPAGALTEDLQGKHIAEMLDMHAAGAVAFSNAESSIENSRTMLLALQYARHTGAPVMVIPTDAYLSQGTLVHEGEMSTRLGLKGMPALAEELAVARDLELLAYAGGRLHFSKISTSGSVERIRKAKKAGLQVTCGVAAHQLLLTDEVLPAFETAHKVWPPLRDESHRQALLTGVADGTIDFICSDHQPEDTEHKFLEFDQAAFGMATLETTLSTVVTAFHGHAALEQAMLALTERPAAWLGLSDDTIQAGVKARLVVCDVAASYTVEQKHLSTKGVNNAMLGQQLNGPIRLVVHGDKTYLPHV